jgi:RNA polymerase sigma-54 factor
MEHNLLLEQRQVLHLSPQMYQSIKILQMNIMELNRWLEQEAQDNPVLEIDFNQVSERSENSNQPAFLEQGFLPKKSNNDTNNDTNREDERSLWTYLSNEKGFINSNVLSIEQAEKFQNTVFQKTTLTEHLLLCFRMVTKDALDFKIGEYLISNIDNNGYLVISCADAAQDLNVPERKVRQILAMIQNCSIPGLGARNLKECLLLQLKHLNLPEKEILKKLILFYLGKLSRKEFKDIGRELKLSYYEIQHLLEILIKNFDPKPGRIFPQDEVVNFLIPDIIVKKVDDHYEIVENRNFLPEVKVSSYYEQMFLKYNQLINISSKKEKEDQKTLEYLKKKMNSAQWIIRCVEQRRNTVLNITRFIIDYQKEFLEKGIAYLKPLSLEVVADHLDLHKSTVSRAIKAKKIQLPRGFYDMNYFFSKGLPQENDELISNEKIKNLIKHYIDSENSYHPYSDQKLATVLRERENILVARRTITKYRQLMEIPSAKFRRRYEKIEKKE